jgi:uncharacterized protein (TIGR03492 family)
MTTIAQKVLLISNGHGEDNHTAHVARTLKKLKPHLELAAMPIVGEGYAYRKLNIPIIGPTQIMPSGGFFYMRRGQLLKDLQAGLLSLTWRQLQAVLNYAKECDLILATGDGVSQSFAYLTGLPFVSFISPLSSLYEGHLNLSPLLWYYFRSPRCLGVFTRDAYTAQDLQHQGLNKVRFGGIPSLDYLQPTGKDLHLHPDLPMLALLPGSRLPEAVRNFSLQLDLVKEIVQVMGEKVQFRAALVPSLAAALPEIAQEKGWHYENLKLTQDQAEIICYTDAFSDIIANTTLVLGMAGLAVHQAVALGKPVLQIPGEGPQFTYRFAEAETRLLGISAQTIGTAAATPAILKEAAQRVDLTVKDYDYLEKCRVNGEERFGAFGASERIAALLVEYLDS